MAEYAIERALEGGRKAFYTTPLKALSNQKFGDFVARYGAVAGGPAHRGQQHQRRGAGRRHDDRGASQHALRAELDTLDGLDVVVMDEVHYLQDPYRGAVWEEILIHLPLSVSVVCLSATVSNAEEFGEWLTTLRGTTRVVIEERRPVPLEHLYMVGPELHPMHVEQGGHLLPNPYVVSLSQRELRTREYRRRGDGRRQYQRIGRPREGHERVYTPRREEVVEVLRREGMLPAIYFVFSRAGCDQSVEWVDRERRPPDDRGRGGADPRVRRHAHRVDGRGRPVGARLTTSSARPSRPGSPRTTPGMVPVFKETVEELFAAGLVKVVFATETLSLGINMPAKTVVIENLWKFSGERHELLTPGAVHAAHRPGRHAGASTSTASPWCCTRREVDFERVAGLATTRTYELTSSFRPSYNMAVNLVRNYSPEEAHHLLNSSFGQFQADRGVVALERQLERDRAGPGAAPREDRVRPRRLRASTGSCARRPDELRRGPPAGTTRTARTPSRTRVAALKPGDVVFVPRASRKGIGGRAVEPGGPPDPAHPGPQVLPSLGEPDFEDPPEPLAQIPLPRLGEREERPLPARPRGAARHRST